mmetsp:Transcript_22085/g.71462  ORF Transcript_22085/g.71462 Transcript_22085/m.71462 type:complete len:596 (+) Transcript_22085:44-1831(+)
MKSWAAAVGGGASAQTTKEVQSSLSASAPAFVPMGAQAAAAVAVPAPTGTETSNGWEKAGNGAMGGAGGSGAGGGGAVGGGGGGGGVASAAAAGAGAQEAAGVKSAAPQANVSVSPPTPPVAASPGLSSGEAATPQSVSWAARLAKNLPQDAEETTVSSVPSRGTARQSGEKSTGFPEQLPPLEDLFAPLFPCRPSRVTFRGLANAGNTCYLNATLQALLGCAPFFAMLSRLGRLRRGRGAGIPRSVAPCLAALAEFMETFAAGSGSSEVISPTMFDSLLERFSASGSAPRQQEDAQEWFSFLIENAHQEFLELQRAKSAANGSAGQRLENGNVRAQQGVGGESEGNGNVASMEAKRQGKEGGATEEEEKDRTESEQEDEVDEWEEVGKRNKSAVTRMHVDEPSSPITAMFGGQLRSVVKSAGARASATVEPFTHLQLSIEGVSSVEQALQSYFQRERLADYRHGGSKVESAATKVLELHAAPRILVLQLKRFAYSTAGSRPSKLTHSVHFSPELNLLKDGTVASNARRAAYKYDLFAVVSHHGSNLSSGHYTADVHRSDNKWMRLDDSSVASVPVGKVLSTHETAYLLFYSERA